MKKAIVPICLLITIALGIFVYINRFINYSVVEVDGYAFKNNDIVENLNNNDDTKKISLQKVIVNDVIYKSNNRYYVGEEKKKLINLDYPIVSKDSSTIYIATNVGDYITDNFDHEVSYPGTIIADSKLYNTTDYEQATNDNYFFVGLNNGLFINMNEINIKSYSYDIKIPINSFIKFEKNSLRYYYLYKGKYLYKEYPIIADKDKFTIGEYQGTYYDTMIKLSIIIPKQEIEEINDDENKDSKEEINGDNSSEIAESSPEYIKKEKNKKEGKSWIAPEVSIKDTYAKTYSYRGMISISDQSATISKSPVFEFKINNSVYLRKTINSSGSFKITGLLPNTKYEVSAYYEYYDENNVKRQKKIKFNDKEYFDIFTTEGTENLNKLDFDLGKVTTETDSFKIESVKIKNDIEDEVINGIKSVVIETEDGNFVFTSSDIKNLTKKIEFEYKSAKTLKSNKNYTGTITVTDTAGNNIPCKNNIFNFKTKQNAPTAKVSADIGKNFTKVDLLINISNKDKVNVSSYRYIVYDENNDVFATKAVYEDEKSYLLEGLDTAKKYTVKVLCDYKTSENYVFNDVEIGNLEFVSYDIEKLGSIPFTVSANTQREDYITSSSASITASFANYDSNDPIYDLIDNEIVFNVVNHETGEVEYSKSINKYDYVVDHVFDIYYSGEKSLKSNTEYDVMLEVYVTSGTKKIPIRTTINSRGFSFKTLKEDAYVVLSNIFVASGYIDFDAYVIDKDSAILDRDEKKAETINLEIYNTAKEKVYTEVLDISDYSGESGLKLNRITINSLNENQKYTFEFKAVNYNDNLNSESNKTLDGSRDFYLGGIKSKIDVEEMIKATNYYNEAEANLFELNDITRWQSKHFSTYSTTEKIKISTEKNSISLGAYNGYRVYNYYLPELIGKDVVLSFKAKRGSDRTGRICLMNNMSSDPKNCFMDLDISEDSYTEYNDITFKVNSTGYISFYIAETDNNFFTNILVLKDLKIEVGTTSTEYKAYDNSKGYIGTFNTSAYQKINPEEENPGIELNNGIYEYYVSLLKDGKRDRTELFQTEDGKIPFDEIRNSVIFDKLDKDEDYKVTFSVYDKDLERYYDLSNLTFETEAEIRVIRNITDFFNMHKNGHYIAVADLDFRSVGTSYGGTFSGTLDMQGHKMYIASSNRSYLINTLGGGGVIENADIHFDLNNTSAKGYYYGLIYDNYGTIQNFSITVDSSVEQHNNYYYSLLGWRNYGIIQNFYFHSKAPVYGYKWVSLGTRVNYGTIKNAYAYADEGVYAIDVGSNIPTADGSKKMTGIFAMETTSGSIIENIYVTSKIYIGENPEAKDKNVGTIVGNLSSATLRNIYAYDDSNSQTNTRDKSLDIMVGSASNINYSNLYYISEYEYKELYSKSRKITALKNVSFQNQVLNNENMFLTDKAWRLGIYPLLDLPDCMPNQEPILLPSITGEDIKFLSVDSIKYLDDDYVASIAVSFYNPKGLNIKGVNIDDISTVELENKPSTNSDMITTINLKLKNPAEYVSYYNLASISTNTGIVELNSPMAFDLYMEISSLTSITDMKTNYRLIEDIDCSKETCKSIGTYTGKLNGSGHTISNLKVTQCFINTLKGTLTDINFTNYENTNNYNRVGIVCTLDGNGDIDNVYSYNSKLNAYSNNGVIYAGGLVGYINSGNVINSAVNKMTINAENIKNAMPNIGGIAGYGSNAIIDTSLARNVNIESNSMPAESTGIGGIIGVFTSGKITNVYATGIIKNNTQYLGGIAGRITGTTASINDAISNVTISGEQDYIGGINGYSAATNNIYKTISLGNLSTKKLDAQYFDRTSGTSINRSRNFAWDRQSLNNVITLDTNGETLLSQEELWNPVIYSSKIGFGSHWVLDGENFREGYIPLLTTASGKIIKGQSYYENEDQNIDDLRIYYESLFDLDSYTIDSSESEYAEGHIGDKYYIEKTGLTINIKNPNMYEIKSIDIDGIDIESVIQYPTNNPDNQITTIKYKVAPERYYDNYYVTKVTYYDENREEKEVDVSFSIGMPFYYNLKSKDDWLRIGKLYYENYIVDRDIDLSGLTTTQLTEKSFNRLVGIGDKRTISGANMTVNAAGSSFIYSIVSELTNIKFDNITFKNNASGNYTGFIKYLNGSMENTDFHNITVDAAKASHVGVISVNQAPIIRNILVDTITIKGVSYVGFIGYSNVLPKTAITLRNETIDATGSYVGGLYGYEKWKEKGVYSSYIVGDNIQINQNITKYGNNVGGLFGYGSGSNISIANSKITGKDYVGGVAGQNSNRTNNYIYAYNNKVVGSTSVGGLMGTNQPIYASLVYNSKISGSSRVGGVVGYSSWPTIYGTGSVSNTVSGTNYSGGIVGYMSSASVQYDYVRDTKVEGENYVGGLVGATTVSDNVIQYNTTNATVTATKANAGGIIGYFNNTSTTTSRYRTRLYHNIVAGSKISAADYAGGLVGRIEKSMYSNQFTNQYVDAEITCTDVNSDHCGYAIGINDSFANIITRLYVYENTSVTTHNTKTLFANSTTYSNKIMFGSGKYSGIATSNEIKTDAFYKTGGSKLRLSGFTWNNTILQSTYPRPNYSKILNKTIPTLVSEMPTPFTVTYANTNDDLMSLQAFSYLPLPQQNRNTSNVGTTINMRMKLFTQLPSAIIYPSSVDTINVEFSDIDSNVSYKLNDSEEQPIEKKTYTFKYDYNTDLSLKISDGISLKEFNYTKKQLRNRISVLENNYYFLKNNNIVSNSKDINITNAANIYDNLVLLTTGEIYDINTKEKQENKITNFELVEDKPLYKFTYLDENIETYYNYSLVNNEFYNGQLFVKNGNLEILDKSIKNKKDKIIIDEYNNKNYLLYLTNEGILYSLKENINYPKEFMNINIADISSNINTNSDIIFILYKDDNYMVFNYKTGSLITKSYENTPSIYDYVSINYRLMVNPSNLDEPVNTNYKESKKLVKKLEKTSIDDVQKEGTTSKERVNNSSTGEISKYTIKYNNNTKSYDVYELAETEYTENNINSNSTIIKQIKSPSIQKVIKKSKVLSDYYDIDTNMEQLKATNVFVKLIIVTIGLVITTALIILGNIVIKKINMRRA